MTEIASDPAAAGPNGIDRVEFWVQTNPGTQPGPLMKVASGGELARFLLALKVVLADRGSAPTLVYETALQAGQASLLRALNGDEIEAGPFAILRVWDAKG